MCARPSAIRRLRACPAAICRSSSSVARSFEIPRCSSSASLPGVDAGAAAVIRQALLDLAAAGAAVLVTSQDLDELAEITDRIAVMFHGRLSQPLKTAEASREKLGLLMGGSSLEQKEAAHAVSA